MRAVSTTLILSYILILLGIYLLASATYDEFRGVTNRPVSLTEFGRRGMGHAYFHRILIHRQQQPDLFRRFMIGHWLWAVGIEAAGWVFYMRR